SGDIEAAKKTWSVVEPMLKDESYHLVVLDELTYMLAYKYLPEADVLAALENRPVNQSVVVTGRGGGSALQAIADTVSEIKEVKHAFKSGVAARKGVDF
ncbi:MAG: cob(I)yrinic acid a,c-diamide adenosyltransferase, partial [Sinobacterium sp.]